MTRLTPGFDTSNWLRNALGEEEHSPLAADPFEVNQALNGIRRDVSRETDPIRRKQLIDEYKAQTSGNSSFVHLVGENQARAFEELLGGPGTALLYPEGSTLERPSAIREEILDILSGVRSESYSSHTAKVLAEKVPSNEKTRVLDQLDEACAFFDVAMARLPKTTGNREYRGTYNPSTAERMRSILELTAGRLRQAEAAKAIDELFTVKNSRFTHATLADTGVSRQDFKTLETTVKRALRADPAHAAGDISALWAAAVKTAGTQINLHDSSKGFARIAYNDPPGDFAKDVEALEVLLSRHGSFRAHDQRPAP